MHNVLIIDDDQELCLLIKRSVLSEDIEADFCNTGKEGLQKLKDHADSFPENYWINTSSNDAVKKFIQMSGNFKTKREIETLLAGEEIIKEIHQELVYPEMYQSVENVWSLLFMTGYLTQRGRVDAKRYKLAIPNLEIRDIFETQIMGYCLESWA